MNFDMVAAALLIVIALIIKELLKPKKKKRKKEKTIEIETSKKTELSYIQNNNNTHSIKKDLYKSIHKKKNEDKKSKGTDYENFVGNYFEEKGYLVAYHGIDNGKKDKGIDLIAKKDNEIVFIQCKNWKKGGRKINQSHIKAFITDTYDYIEKNPMYRNYDIKRIYAISNPILTKSAYAYIRNNQDKIKYLYLKIEE